MDEKQFLNLIKNKIKNVLVMGVPFYPTLSLSTFGYSCVYHTKNFLCYFNELSVIA